MGKWAGGQRGQASKGRSRLLTPSVLQERPPGSPDRFLLCVTIKPFDKLKDIISRDAPISRQVLFLLLNIISDKFILEACCAQEFC